MTVKPGSWTVFFSGRGFALGVQIILQWSTGKSTLYTSLKKKQGIYFEGRLSFLGFKYESEVTAFLEQQGEAKER